MPPGESATTSATQVGVSTSTGASQAGQAAGKHFLPSLADIFWAKTAMQHEICASAATYWRTACLRAQDWKHLPWHRSAVSVGIHVLTALNRRLDAVAAVDRRAVRGLWGMLGVAATLVLVLNGGTLPGSRTAILDAQFDAHTFPVAAAEHLAQDGLPAGNGFTTYNWGSYLDDALPAYHPFVDSRTDVESVRLLQQYLDIVGIAPNWSALLDQYHVI